MILIENIYKKISLLACLFSFFAVFTTYGQSSGTQIGARLSITKITPSINTGQNYSPWLNDDLNDLVQNEWSPLNLQYIDVTLALAGQANVTQVSLFDGQGSFPGMPTSIYAINGNKRTLLGVFTGESYQQWVNITPTKAVAADGIIIHKYGNNIPAKVKIFGVSNSATPTQTQAVISFPALATKTMGAAAFDLTATSNNTSTPITFSSSNSGVVSVSNASGKWQATVVGVGTANITASQAASSSYLAAANVTQTISVQAAPVATLVPTNNRLSITKITPSINTGQNYLPWLNDDLNDLVQNEWSPLNLQYIDVTLALAGQANVTQVSLFDGQGSFPGMPTSIYAVNGTTQTLIGVFTGESYQQWVDFKLAAPVTAGAIVIHKYGNNIPVKVNIFGVLTGAAPTQTTQAVISFPALATKTMGAAAFDLTATSNNTSTPITFSSSNSGVVSVSNASGKWQATVVGVGTANITASQAASSSYLAAANVTQAISVQAAPVSASGVGKIPIDGKRWYQLTNSPDAIAELFDGITSANVTNGYGRVIGTYDSFYPLQPGETFNIQSIKFFDGWGSNPDAPMTLSIITDTWQRINIGSFLGTNDQQWIGPYPNRPTTFTLDNAITNARYIVITSSWAFPTEMEFYGTYTLPTPPSSPVPTPAALASQKHVKLAQSMGVNGFEWDLEDGNNPAVVEPVRLAAVKNFTGIRHYLDWDKLESVQGSYTFNPSHLGSWNYDAMYERLKQEGIEVLACLKTQPGWMAATWPADQRDAENVPVIYGRDFAAPNSYLEQAKLGFQFAARYGSNANVDRNLLKVDTSPPRWTNDPVNQVKVGLNLIKYIECDNERDKWWKGRKGYQTAGEYAANLSAFYDGNKNTMGPGVGVKNADPNMVVVMGGLASPNPDYVKGMVEWCRQYRGYRADGSVNLCWDVINYHHYANDAGSSQAGNPTRGAAPEVSDAGQVAQSFLAMSHQYANDMPVWITEAGFDQNQGSPLKAIAIGSRTVEQTQADWILRTSLAYARWGIERVFLYWLYDSDPSNPIQFSSMGLINSDRTPKLAAQYLSQANKLIGTYSYQQTLNADPVVDRYELNGQSAYVLVVPDEKGRTATYTLNLGSAPYADVYRLTNGSAMSVQRVTLQGGQLTLQVTETPLFVLPAGSSASNTAAATTSAKSRTQSAAVTTAASGMGETVALTAFPNPFTQESSVQFTTTITGNATLVVYDAQGRVVRKLFSGSVTAGQMQEVVFKANELPSGIYTIRLTTDKEVVHQRVVINK
jgi:endoglucanase